MREPEAQFKKVKSGCTVMHRRQFNRHSGVQAKNGMSHSGGSGGGKVTIECEGNRNQGCHQSVTLHYWKCG